MHKKASEFYNELLGKYFDEYKFSDAERKKMDAKYNSVDLLFDTSDYSYWFVKKNWLIQHRKMMKKKNR